MDIYQQHIDWQVLQDLVDCARDAGVDLEAIERKLGQSLNLKKGLATKALNLESYSLLDRRLVDAVRKAIYSQAGYQGMSLRDYEILFHYMLGAEDLLGALKRVPAFTSLVQHRLREARMELTLRGDTAVLSLNWGVGEAQKLYATLFFYELSRLTYILEWMIGRSIDIRRVEVPFDPQSVPARILESLRYPVRFAGRSYELHFSSQSLYCPLVRDLDDLQSFLKVYPAVAAVGIGFDSLSDRIASILISQSLGSQSMLMAPELSAALNMSEATMRRRLREEGTSYGAIRRQCQLKVAGHLLKRSNFDVGAISYQVGFADDAAFRRAFKNWTGLTPTQYRGQVGENEPDNIGISEVRNGAGLPGGKPAASQGASEQ